MTLAEPGSPCSLPRNGGHAVESLALAHCGRPTSFTGCCGGPGTPWPCQARGCDLNIENFGDGQELPKLPAGVRVTPGAPTSRILARLPCRLVHFNATEHPPAGWTARQLVEACGLEESPRNLIRDRDQIYGERFSRQARTLGHPGSGHYATLALAKCLCRA